MKNKLALTLAASLIAFSSTIALADPRPVNFDIQCPNVQIQSHMLSNYGNYIAGYGLERIQGQDENQIYFKSKSSIKNIPVQLDNYSNAGVIYNNTTGDITCAYNSFNGDPSFEVTYTLTNGKGGKATTSGNDRINIIIPIGFKA